MASFHGRGAHASAAKKRDASRKSDISVEGFEKYLRTNNGEGAVVKKR